MSKHDHAVPVLDDVDELPDDEGLIDADEVGFDVDPEDCFYDHGDPDDEDFD